MNTLRRFSSGQYSIPGGTSWYLADLGEFRGKQELYTCQSPQRLKALREHALIESAVSSNRLEGVEVDPKRLHDVLVKAKPLFRDRAVVPRIYRRAIGKDLPSREPGNGASRTRQSKRQTREMHRPRARRSLDQNRLRQERVMSLKEGNKESND